MFNDKASFLKKKTRLRILESSDEDSEGPFFEGELFVFAVGSFKNTLTYITSTN